MGTFWGLWGQHEDNGDDADNGDDRDTMWRPQTMETTWGPSGGYGDNMRTMGTMWGRREDDGDHVGTTKSLKMP